MELDGELRLCAAVMTLAVKHLEAPLPERRNIASKKGGVRPISGRELGEELRIFQQAYLSAARFFLVERSSGFEWMASAVQSDTSVMRERVSRIVLARHRSDPECFDFSASEVALAKKCLGDAIELE